MPAKSFLPAASTNVTLLKSTRIDPDDFVEAVSLQHFSSSPTQAAASFPSTTTRVSPRLMPGVIPCTTDFVPPAARCKSGSNHQPPFKGQKCRSQQRLA